MSGSQQISIEELIEKYKRARKIRRMYALKQFFKIKRGALGVAILVILTALSLLSPWIAPEPNEFRHAPLSKPGWLRIFDPNAIGDFNLLDLRVSDSSQISTLRNDTQIDTGKIYAKYNLSQANSTRFEGIFFEPNDGYWDKGCAVLKIADNTSIPVSGNVSPKITFSFNIKVKWDKKVYPYAAYFMFAHKFIVGLKPLLEKEVELMQGGSETVSLNLTGYIGAALSGVNIFVEIVEPQAGDKLRVTIETGSEPDKMSVKVDRIISERLAVTKTHVSYLTNIRLQNLSPRAVKVKVWMTVETGIIYPTVINLYLNLWNETANREMTRDELADYLEERFQIVPPSEELTDRGLLIYKDISKADEWITFGHPVKTYLTAREIYQEPFFQKGNIIVIRLEAELSLSILYAKLRQWFGKLIEIKWYIDNVKIEIQDKYYGLMGTDKDGRDIFAMIIDGLKISLLVGFTATFANIAVGVTLGLVSGYVGGKVDEVIMRIVDFFMSIPGLPLLMVLAFVFYTMNVDPLIAIIVVLSIFGWAGMARTIRSQVLALRANVYVEAARASGASSFYIIRKHILPGVWPLVLMYLMTGVIGNILAEAGLSFLGILRPDWNSLGKMIQEAAGISAATGGGAGGFGFRAIHWIFFPGFILMLIGFAFYSIGDAYDELINPKRRKRF